jgi:hypothetical protein
MSQTCLDPRQLDGRERPSRNEKGDQQGQHNRKGKPALRKRACRAPLPDDALKIVARGVDKGDQAAAWKHTEESNDLIQRLPLCGRARADVHRTLIGLRRQTVVKKPE